jgi:hypothetical protein
MNIETKNQIMQAAKEAYESQGLEFPASYSQATHRLGNPFDGLSCFIRSELEEGIDWDNKDENPKDRAITLLSTAISNLRAVKDALLNL